MRRSLARVLGLCPEIRVVGEAADVLRAGAEIRRRRPHAVIVDLRLPGGPVLDCIRSGAWAPGTAVIATTMSCAPSIAEDALRCGATAVVLKDDADPELVRAVIAAVAGERFVSSRLRAPGAPPARPRGRVAGGGLGSRLIA